MNYDVVASIAGGLSEGLGAAIGGKKQSDSARKARAVEMWKLRQAMPFIQAGQEALPQFQAGIGEMPTYANALATLMQDPAYQFAQQEAARATQGSAAAQNMLLSGRAQQALQDRAQNIANTMGADIYARQMQEWTNKQNALQNLMTGTFTGLGMANNLGQAQMNVGAAHANRAYGISNAMTNMIENIAGSINPQGQFGSGGGGGNPMDIISMLMGKK